MQNCPRDVERGQDYTEHRGERGRRGGCCSCRTGRSYRWCLSGKGLFPLGTHCSQTIPCWQQWQQTGPSRQHRAAQSPLFARRGSCFDRSDSGEQQTKNSKTTGCTTGFSALCRVNSLGLLGSFMNVSRGKKPNTFPTLSIQRSRFYALHKFLDIVPFSISLTSRCEVTGSRSKASQVRAGRGGGRLLRRALRAGPHSQVNGTT